MASILGAQSKPALRVSCHSIYEFWAPFYSTSFALCLHMCRRKHTSRGWSHMIRNQHSTGKETVHVIFVTAPHFFCGACAYGRLVSRRDLTQKSSTLRACGNKIVQHNAKYHRNQLTHLTAPRQPGFPPGTPGRAGEACRSSGCTPSGAARSAGPSGWWSFPSLQ